MSARLVLCLLAATTIGCSISGPSEVTITDLVVIPDASGFVRSGTFNVHVARPASAEGSSGIRLHTLAIAFERTDGSAPPLTVSRLTGDLPGDVDPGQEIVSPMGFELREPGVLGLPPFDPCLSPDGFSLSGVYFDDAEQSFFPVVSEPTWVFPKPLTGTTWGTTLGDAAGQIERDLAVFPDGSSVLVGATFDSLPPSGLVPFPGADPLPFLIRLDPAGEVVWTREATLTTASLPASTQGPNLVAAAPDGGILVAGDFGGTLDLGGGKITSVGDTDVFLARLDAAGKPLEMRRFGDSLKQTVTTMDVDAAGDVFLAGTLAGAIDFGSGPIAPLIDPAFTSYYVARLPPAGAPAYARVPLVLEFPSNFTAALGADGTAVLGGSYEGGAWIDALPQPKAMIETGVLVKLAADGSIAWSAVITGAAVIQAAIDEGDVVAVVNINDLPGKAVIGGQELMGGPWGETFLARFDPAGALRYAIPLGGVGSLEVTRLAIDSAGHSLLSGAILETLLLEGAEADPSGRPSSFVKELDRSGARIRSMAFGCAPSPADIAVARSGSREPVLATSFLGAVDFGKGTTRSAGGADLLVAKLPAK